MTKRTEKIIKDAEEKNIPIFVFTAKDKHMLDILEMYRDFCDNDECDEDFLQDIDNCCRTVHSWQNNNPDLVKKPD